MAESITETEVLLSVPVRLAEQVAQIVADLKAGRSLTQLDTASDASIVEVPRQGLWNRHKVEALEDAVEYKGVRALFGHCARTPGSWVAKHEVENDLGISAIQLRNELGALSKLTKRLFGDATWPIEWNKHQGIYRYRMDDQMAMWWLEAAEASR